MSGQDLEMRAIEVPIEPSWMGHGLDKQGVHVGQPASKECFVGILDESRP